MAKCRGRRWCFLKVRLKPGNIFNVPDRHKSARNESFNVTSDRLALFAAFMRTSQYRHRLDILTIPSERTDEGQWGVFAMANGERIDAVLMFEGPGGSRSYWPRFSSLLSIAVIVATVGLYRDSGAVVIAAMLLAPLMTPILGIGAALVTGRQRRLVWVLSCVGAATLATCLLAYMVMLVFNVPIGVTIPSEIMARTDPGLEELAVALSAGIAGAYMQMRTEEMGLLPGVAIGVSLVPPLCAVGILFYFEQPGLAWEAMLLYLTNLAAIVLSAAAVFFFLGVRPPKTDRATTTGIVIGTTVTVIIVAVIAIQLTSVTVRRFQEISEEAVVLSAVQQWVGGHPVDVLEVDVRGDNVMLQLLFDIPLRAADEGGPPGQYISTDLEPSLLIQEIEHRLGRDVTVDFQGVVQYAEIIR
jgi:uncharacterized hydrophobic protein (TIGR00271 family)